MEYRTLGKTGLRVSAIGFGGQPIGGNIWMGEWRGYSRADDAESLRTLERALDVGVNFIDLKVPVSAVLLRSRLMGLVRKWSWEKWG